MSLPPEQAFNDHAAALRRLGDALRTAAEVQYLPAPGSAREGSRGIPNPTLDTVLEPRRVKVSAEMTRTAVGLWKATEAVEAMTQNINNAVAEWHGEPTST